MNRRSLLAGGAAFGLASTLPHPGLSQMRGFAMPAEEQRHARTFMQWPVNRRIHRDPVFLDMLQRAIARIANAIVDYEPVVMLMDKRYVRAARRKLSRNVEIWDIPTNDLWARDSGPPFVKNEAGDLAVLDFHFNGWGGKQVHNHDGKVARRVAERLGLPVIDTGLTGEPGGVESDGAGTLLANASCWVNPNRNTLSQRDIGKRLLKAYGATKIIWTPGVKGLDITDDHIDTTARFVEPGQVLIQLPRRPYRDDPFAISAWKAHDILRDSTDARGKPLKLTVLPAPVRTRIRANDFVSSYVNFYVCNDALIAAQFGDKRADAKARELLEDLHPHRDVVMLNVDPVGEVGGGIHCATQQMPA